MRIQKLPRFMILVFVITIFMCGESYGAVYKKSIGGGGGPSATQEVIVTYIENNSIAITLYNVIKEKHPDLPIKMQKMGPVLGVHLGLDVISLAVFSN